MLQAQSAAPGRDPEVMLRVLRYDKHQRRCSRFYPMTRRMVEDFQLAYSDAIREGRSVVTFQSTRNAAVIIPVADIIEVTIEKWRDQ